MIDDLTPDDTTTVFRALFDSSPDGIVLVDAEGVIRLANPAASVLFGLPREELVGSTVERLVPDGLRSGHRAHRLAYQDAPERRPMGTGLELEACHADHGTFPVEISLSPVESGGESLTIATVRDVSERQASRSSIELLGERERIGRDIHDMVIQRVFAAGMSLQAVIPLVDSLAARERISAVTDDLDDTIRELRAAIFRLGTFDDERSLAAQLGVVAAERSRVLGFVPELRISGSLDGLPDYVAEQMLATVTEALSNVARHAEATEACIDVRRANGVIELTVTDNGRGVTGTPKSRGGLSNMMWRAAELGGSCTVGPNVPSGTTLTWRVPT